MIRFIFIFFLFGLASSVFGATAEELQKQISNRNSQIQALEEEIIQYQNDIIETGKEANNLENAIEVISTNIRKIDTDIRVTEGKIDVTNLNIERLSLEIQEKEERIAQGLTSIKTIITTAEELESQTVVEMLLGQESLTTFWNDLERLEDLQTSIDREVTSLLSAKEALEFDQELVKEEKTSLVSLNTRFGDQKRIARNNRYEKDQLLKETKNKEENYKELLAEREAQKEAFEQELADLESQLRITIDPNSLPSRGSNILSYPLRDIYITQNFGVTEDSKRLYRSGSHNGVDFRASRGTDVFASAGGTVIGTGNTDSIPGCFSYGKWALIKHSSGLSTLYAHLDLISVTNGEKVARGDLVGYSGNTGYSTGPHLHFSVYASQGVTIERLGDIKAITNCADAYIPVAPRNAYLDPLDYL